MRNLLTLIIFSLIYDINLKLEEAEYDFIIKVEDSADSYIWNNNTIALRKNITIKRPLLVSVVIFTQHHLE